MKTETERYVCYTLTVDKDRRYELIKFFDEVFFDTDYQIISESTLEDIDCQYGSIYADILTSSDEFSIRFYVEPQQKQVTATKLQGLPEGIFVAVDNIDFSEAAVMEGYKKRFRLTDACDIVFEETGIEPNAAPIQIILPPQQAFGTGSHMSTQLAAQLLERYTTSKDRLIDVGTGTGILAIYAAKRGIKQILAVDIDPISITEAEANIKKNGLSAKIVIKQNNFLTGIDITGFNVIIANLSLQLYKKFLPEILSQLSSEQTLLFSGVIEAERAAFEAFLTELHSTIKEKIMESGWVAYYVQRNKSIRM